MDDYDNPPDPKPILPPKRLVCNRQRLNPSIAHASKLDQVQLELHNLAMNKSRTLRKKKNQLLEVKPPSDHELEDYDEPINHSAFAAAMGFEDYDEPIRHGTAKSHH